MALSPSEVRDRLRGVAVGLLTPFDADGEIMWDALRNNVATLASKGPETFLAVANISEYHSLTGAERRELAAVSIEALPDDACVLGGVGGPTGEAQALIEDYAEIGVDAMMVMPPDHTYLHERGLLEYYRALAAVTDRPLVPYVRGFEPSAAYLADLTRVDGVVGIKYALDDHVKLGDAVANGADDVVWVNGAAEPHSVSYWAEGVEGFTAGVSNFRPELGLALFDALTQADWGRARTLRNACLPIQRLRGESGPDNEIPGAMSVPVVKKGLDLAGMTGGHVREPIRPLGEDEERRMEDYYAELDETIEGLLG